MELLPVAPCHKKQPYRYMTSRCGSFCARSALVRLAKKIFPAVSIAEHPANAAEPTLTSLGISKKISSRAQYLAKPSDSEF